MLLKPNLIFIKKTKIKDGTVFLSVNSEAEKVSETQLVNNLKVKIKKIFSTVLKVKMNFSSLIC